MINKACLFNLDLKRSNNFRWISNTTWITFLVLGFLILTGSQTAFASACITIISSHNCLEWLSLFINELTDNNWNYITD